MSRCGFCSFMSDLFRRSMCAGDRRNSNDSFYGDLNDQETVRLDGRLDEDDSDDELEIHWEIKPRIVFDPIYGIWGVRNRVQFYGRFLTSHKRRKKRLIAQRLTKERDLLDELYFGQTQLILDKSANWSFNAFVLDNVSGGRCLPVLGLHLFHQYNLFGLLNLDPIKAWKLFSHIENSYHHDNPYHNSIHATDVTQAMHCFLQQKQILDFLKPVEILAALLAAMAHDIDHPGVNQAFLVSNKNHLTAIYGTQSVLENHHWSCSICCIEKSDLFEDLNCDRAEFEKLLGSLIMATDITRQAFYLTQFKDHLDGNTLDLKKKNHRILVLQMALKCADISNPCRPWDISRVWSKKVCEEFFLQGDWEKRLNFPISPMCDRKNDTIPVIQTGFLKHVVSPLVTEWHRFLQNKLSTTMLQNLCYNQSQWEILVAKELLLPAEKPKPDYVKEPVPKGNSESDTIFDRVDYSSDSELIMQLPPRHAPVRNMYLAEVVGRRPFSVMSDYLDTDDEQFGRAKWPIDLQNKCDDQLKARNNIEGNDNVKVEDEAMPCLQRSVSEDSIFLEPLLPFPCPTDQLDREQIFPPFDRELNENSDPEAAIINDDVQNNELDEDEVGSDEYDSDFISILEKENLDDFIPNFNQDRRESAPAENSTKDDLLLGWEFKPEEETFDEAVPNEDKDGESPSSALPNFLRRTLSGRDCWNRRRGSEPLNMTSAVRVENANGARKMTHAISSWIFKMQEKTKAHLPRRLSLPLLFTTENPDEENNPNDDRPPTDEQ